MSVLFNTCILIDYLNAVAAARDELALHREKTISTITWMEVLVSATPDTEAGKGDFLKRLKWYDWRANTNHRKSPCAMNRQ